MKILYTLLLTTALSTAVFADITKEQLNTYMKASGYDIALKTMQEQSRESIKQQSMAKGSELPSDVLDAMTKAMNEEESVSKFTDTFMSLDENFYKEIIKFYRTDLGKKTASIQQEMDTVKMQTEMPEFSTKVIPENRNKLLLELSKVMKMEEFTIAATKPMLDIMVKAMPQEMQEEMKKQMEEQLEQMKPMMKQQTAITIAYLYKDFSDKELEKSIVHYKTKPAQAEVASSQEGQIAYMNVMLPKIYDIVGAHKEKSSK